MSIVRSVSSFVLRQCAGFVSYRMYYVCIVHTVPVRTVG